METEERIKKFQADPVRQKYIAKLDNLFSIANFYTAKDQVRIYRTMQQPHKKKYEETLQLLKNYNTRNYLDVLSQIPIEERTPQHKIYEVLKTWSYWTHQFE